MKGPGTKDVTMTVKTGDRVVVGMEIFECDWSNIKFLK